MSGKMRPGRTMGAMHKTRRNVVMVTADRKRLVMPDPEDFGRELAELASKRGCDESALFNAASAAGGLALAFIVHNGMSRKAADTYTAKMYAAASERWASLDAASDLEGGNA
ncbi:hypothetical protein NBRC3280_0714 [Acetobacter pasteurianus NBRC 3280]|uniref:Uncharacterized protein n=1 Tax=Acetobacter pasteurianus NBRC 3278 TaxID=1226660 RepID=A0A401X1H7_ACEPA|nr:hypothetical protein [Acetobacter pasteurianus]GCD61703.1 hypothetical protein NBRC3278_0796 [Acetobacter pasteurianus NBRC 3278]GCD68079.1 hypothetical protein NBRC3280_0714 [Acetobacter pasteurianus NBRC 3280]